MTITVDDDRLAQQILRAIQTEINTAAEEEIEAAKARLEVRVREKLGTIALSLLKNYDLQRNSDNLTILVRDQRT